MKYLYEKLEEYVQTDYYPFHMPGHKRKAQISLPAYERDLTEITGFDNLHDAQEIIKQAQDRAAKLFSTKETYFLINGSTCGLLAAISANTKKGGHILIARNCHKAVYHAIELKELTATYIFPPICSTSGIQGGISPEEIEEALIHNSNIETVVITSPTYEGVVSDIEAISEKVHKYGKILIVDEAHGSHFALDPQSPKSALQCNADIVIHSLHKTLPALTQAALLHVNSKKVQRNKIKHYLEIYQTSSPSYVIMSSIDYCIHLLEEKRKPLFYSFHKQIRKFYENTSSLQHLNIIINELQKEKKIEKIGKNNIFDFDKGKIVISTLGTNMTGHQLYKILQDDFHIQLEMAEIHYVIAIATIMDSEEGFQRLSKALTHIDLLLKKEENTSMIDKEPKQHHLMKALPIGIACDAAMISILLEQAIDKTSGEYCYVYPPGIPFIVPGEIITKEAIEQIRLYQKNGLNIMGLEDAQLKKIKVLK